MPSMSLCPECKKLMIRTGREGSEDRFHCAACNYTMWFPSDNIYEGMKEADVVMRLLTLAGNVGIEDAEVRLVVQESTGVWRARKGKPVCIADRTCEVEIALVFDGSAGRLFTYTLASGRESMALVAQWAEEQLARLEGSSVIEHGRAQVL